jgi:DNA-binding SARP family transcriptional activator
MRGSRKTQALFAFLILHRGQISARSDVAFRLWPDHPEQEARANLRRHMYELQRCLPQGAWFLIDAREVALTMDARVAVDVDAFWAAMTIGDYEEAIRVYEAELLQSSSEEWLVPIRDRTMRAYQNALSCCIEERSARADVDGALLVAQKLTIADPWREDAVRNVMRLHEQRGDRAAALKCYQEFALRLQAEFNASTSADTTALYDSIRSAKRGDSPGQLAFFDRPDADWVGGFPWWWVARLRQLPIALAVAASLRTLEVSRYESFELPLNAHEKVGLSQRDLERVLREICAHGILEQVEPSASKLRRYRFVFEEPTHQREHRNGHASGPLGERSSKFR